MLLTASEIERAIQEGAAAFPRFTRWDHVNEEDGEHFGFAMWAQYEVPDDDKRAMPRRFFVTLDTYQDYWRGHLTIGQHQYMWSSADCGDAWLLDTQPCSSLSEAIAGLKIRMRELFEAFSVT